MTTRVKRRKAVRKTENIVVRVTPEQKATLVAEADRVGLGVSSWLVSLGLRAASERAEKG